MDGHSGKHHMDAAESAQYVEGIFADTSDERSRPFSAPNIGYEMATNRF